MTKLKIIRLFDVVLAIGFDNNNRFNRITERRRVIESNLY